MKVLVIGASGQLGQSLAAAKKPANIELFTVSHPDCDITLPETVVDTFNLIEPDLVINAAAYTAVDKAESEPELARAINTEGACTLARSCSSRNIPVIHISTDYVFDGSKSAPYVEDDLVAPLGVYGLTKLEGEQEVAKMCVQHIVLRTAWIVSPFGKNFVKTMLRLSESQAEISVVGDQTGSPTYAPHLATAIFEICQSIFARDAGSQIWGTYHIAGTGEATWFDMAQEVFFQSNRLGGGFAAVRPIGTADYPTPARRPANSRLNCTKLARVFGIALPDWHDGVSECVAELYRRKLDQIDS